MSVIVATVGMSMRRRRRSLLSTTVIAGYVDTTTSGSRRWISRRSSPPRADPAQHLLGHPADRREVLERAVVEGVGARRDAQLRAVAVGDDRAQSLAHRREPVDDRHRDRLAAALELLLESARRGRVALADVSREDQYPTRAIGARSRRFVSASEAHRKRWACTTACAGHVPTRTVPARERKETRRCPGTFKPRRSRRNARPWMIVQCDNSAFTARTPATARPLNLARAALAGRRQRTSPRSQRG